MVQEFFLGQYRCNVMKQLTDLPFIYLVLTKPHFFKPVSEITVGLPVLTFL